MAASSNTTTDAKASSEWILVVDDDQPIRNLVARQLEDTGAEVVGAESADAALRILYERRALPVLILIDVLMPGMDGLTLARRLQSRFGDRTKLAIISGHVNDAAWWPVELRELPFLPKPFRLADLLELLERARAERKPGG